MKRMINIQKGRLKSKRISIILGIILFIVNLTLMNSCINLDFTNSLFVLTKDENTNIINYYEVNDKGKRRKVDEFEPDKMEEFKVNNCYKSYISNNKVLNKLTLDTCIIEDNTGKSIEITDEFKKIVEKVSDINHAILKNKILKLNNEYYAVVELNVNLWSPYGLYYYDRDNDELKHLYTFDGENIIGLKIK
jgi:hypothetical protein